MNLHGASSLLPSSVLRTRANVAINHVDGPAFSQNFTTEIVVQTVTDVLFYCSRSATLNAAAAVVTASPSGVNHLFLSSDTLCTQGNSGNGSFICVATRNVARFGVPLKGMTRNDFRVRHGIKMSLPSSVDSFGLMLP